MVKELLHDALSCVTLRILLGSRIPATVLCGGVVATTLSWERLDQTDQKVDRCVHRLLVLDIFEGQVHKVNLCHLVLESLFVLELLQDVDQAGESSLSGGLWHLSVALLGDLPELIKIEVLA